MKVGDYVRTDNGCICKVLKYTDISDNDFYVNTDSQYDVIYKSWIVKSSPKIIDLIEVGDYVNGYYVSMIWQEGEITHYVDDKPIKRKERQITIQAPSYGGIIHLHNKDIKSIVTKEQFEAIKYEVN